MKAAELHSSFLADLELDGHDVGQALRFNSVLDDPADFVRIEIGEALSIPLTVIVLEVTVVLLATVDWSVKLNAFGLVSTVEKDQTGL